MKSCYTLFVLAVGSQIAGGAPRLRVSATSPPVIYIVYNDGDGTLQPSAASNVSWMTPKLTPAPTCDKRDCYTLLLGFGPGTPSTGMAIATVTVSDPAAIDSPQQVEVDYTNRYIVPQRIDFYSAAGRCAGVPGYLYRLSRRAPGDERGALAHTSPVSATRM